MTESGPVSSPGTKLDGLEIVRAVAAVEVVASHVFLFKLLPGNAVVNMATAFATEAVMVFFVLSGVVITLSRQRDMTPRRLPIHFLQKRVIRLYPILVAAICLAAYAEFATTGAWPEWKIVVGNLLFLQSIQGYVVSTPAFDPPLWSLSYEMSFYLLFTATLCAGRIWPIWWIAAAACTVLSARDHTGLAGHLVSVLSLSLPWLFGSALARHRDTLPRISTEVGLCILVIGLLVARSPLTADFYDCFRLCAFSLFACPVILSLIQDGRQPPFRGQAVARVAAFAMAATLLWTLSPSLTGTKIALTVAGFAAAAIPIGAMQCLVAGLKRLKAPLVYVGSISYALYAVHVPILYLVGNTPFRSVSVRFTIFLVGTWLTAHVLEREIQPRIRQALIGRKRVNMAASGSGN